jgi:hemolysin III
LGLLLVIWGIAAATAWRKLTAPANALAGSWWPPLALGCLGLLIAEPLARSPGGRGALLWLLAAGIAYTTGLFFYTRDHRPLYHAVWHLFVLAGSTCQFCLVWLCVVPRIG